MPSIPSISGDTIETLQTKDAMVRLLGMTGFEQRPGYGKVVMPFDERHKNIMGVAHGGALFTLADVAIGVASNPQGYAVLTLDSSISYLKPGVNGPFTAVAELLSSGYRIDHYEVKITDATNTIIAHCHVSAYKKRSS